MLPGHLSDGRKCVAPAHAQLLQLAPKGVVFSVSSYLCLDQQQGVVAQGIEGVEAGQLGSGQLLADQL